jgi:hypothetical protein
MPAPTPKQSPARRSIMVEYSPLLEPESIKDITTASWYFEEGISWWIRQTTKHAERIIVELSDEVRQIDKEAKHLLELCIREQERISRLTSEQHQLDAEIQSDLAVKSAHRMLEDYRSNGMQAGHSIESLITTREGPSGTSSREPSGPAETRRCVYNHDIC